MGDPENVQFALGEWSIRSMFTPIISLPYHAMAANRADIFRICNMICLKSIAFANLSEMGLLAHSE